MELAIASEGDGEGGVEEEKGASLLGAPLKGRSISTNSRSCKTKKAPKFIASDTMTGSGEGKVCHVPFFGLPRLFLVE